MIGLLYYDVEVSFSFTSFFFFKLRVEGEQINQYLCGCGWRGEMGKCFFAAWLAMRICVFFLMGGGRGGGCEE
jgi:hypothetical protein